MQIKQKNEYSFVLMTKNFISFLKVLMGPVSLKKLLSQKSGGQRLRKEIKWPLWHRSWT
jgi:hypothetical protein